MGGGVTAVAAAALTVSWKLVSAVPPLPSLTATATVNGEPVLLVGVPLTTPAVLIVSPGGKPVALNVSGSLSGSLAVTVRLKAVPTVAVCGPRGRNRWVLIGRWWRRPDRGLNRELEAAIGGAAPAVVDRDRHGERRARVARRGAADDARRADRELGRQAGRAERKRIAIRVARVGREIQAEGRTQSGRLRGRRCEGRRTIAVRADRDAESVETVAEVFAVVDAHFDWLECTNEGWIRRRDLAAHAEPLARACRARVRS